MEEEYDTGNCPNDEDGAHSWVFDKCSAKYDVSQYHCRNCGKVVVE